MTARTTLRAAALLSILSTVAFVAWRLFAPPSESAPAEPTPDEAVADADEESGSVPTLAGSAMAPAMSPRVARPTPRPPAEPPAQLTVRVPRPPEWGNRTDRTLVVEIDADGPSPLRAWLGHRTPPEYAAQSAPAGVILRARRDAADGSWTVDLRGVAPGRHRVALRESGEGVSAFGAPVEWTTENGPSRTTLSLPGPEARAHLAIEVMRGGERWTGGRFRVLAGGVSLGEVDRMSPKAPRVLDVPAGTDLVVEMTRWPGWRAVPGPPPVTVRAEAGGTATAVFDLGAVFAVRFCYPPDAAFPSNLPPSLWRYDDRDRLWPCSELAEGFAPSRTAYLPAGRYFARHQTGEFLGNAGTARFAVGFSGVLTVDLAREPPGPDERWTFQDERGAPMPGQVTVWRVGVSRLEDAAGGGGDLAQGRSPPIRLPDGEYLVYAGGRGVRRTWIRGGRPTEPTIRFAPPLPPRTGGGGRGGAGNYNLPPNILSGRVDFGPRVEPDHGVVAAEPVGAEWGKLARPSENGSFSIGGLAPGTHRVWFLPWEWTPDVPPGPHATVTLEDTRGASVTLKP